MVERIKAIMEYYQMKPGQFADAVGIQRSVLSHVLSGRNKPSLDFVLRIKNHFPDIRLDWLILGKGEMFAKNDKGAATLFSQENVVKSGVSLPEEEKPRQVAESLKEGRQTEPRVKEEEPAPYFVSGAGERLEKIVFFYRDGTFRAYAPKNER